MGRWIRRRWICALGCPDQIRGLLLEPQPSICKTKWPCSPFPYELVRMPSFSWFSQRPQYFQHVCRRAQRTAIAEKSAENPQKSSLVSKEMLTREATATKPVTSFGGLLWGFQDVMKQQEVTRNKERKTKNMEKRPKTLQKLPRFCGGFLWLFYTEKKKPGIFF